MSSLKVETSKGGAWFSSEGRIAWLSLDDLTSPRDALKYLREKGIECELSLVKKVLKDLKLRIPKAEPKVKREMSPVDPTEVRELKTIVASDIKAALATWFEDKLLGVEGNFHKHMEEYVTDIALDTFPRILWRSRRMVRCVKHYIKREVKKLSPSEVLKLAREIMFEDADLATRLGDFSWDLAERILTELRGEGTVFKFEAMTKKFDEFARRVLEEVRESGEVGITAFQIAQRLGVERSRVSMALYVLKKLGVVENFRRNLWKAKG